MGEGQESGITKQYALRLLTPNSSIHAIGPLAIRHIERPGVRAFKFYVAAARPAGFD
jgi:hypothetical protein